MSREITSAANPKLRLIRRLLSERRFRQRERAFVVEGTRWMWEVLRSGYQPELWLATGSWIEQNGELVEALSRANRPPLQITEGLLRETAATETPSGVLAVLPLPKLPWPASPTFLLVLDKVRDPGNAGTLLRSAAAAGVDGVIFAPGTVDPFNPKVVRSSMGAILRLPIREASWSMVSDLTASCPLTIADGKALRPYTDPDWSRPAAILIGGEATGPSREATELAAGSVSIPMNNQTESLNAAIAGSIIMFEIVRQRREKTRNRAGLTESAGES